MWIHMSHANKRTHTHTETHTQKTEIIKCTHAQSCRLLSCFVRWLKTLNSSFCWMIKKLINLGKWREKSEETVSDAHTNAHGGIIKKIIRQRLVWKASSWAERAGEHTQLMIYCQKLPSFTFPGFSALLLWFPLTLFFFSHHISVL